MKTCPCFYQAAKGPPIPTPEMITKQAGQYKMLFDVFRKYKGTLTGITFWNVSGKSTWLDNFSVPGRKDYPLLFDQNQEPKPE